MVFRSFPFKVLQKRVPFKEKMEKRKETPYIQLPAHCLGGETEG